MPLEQTNQGHKDGIEINKPNQRYGMAMDSGKSRICYFYHCPLPSRIPYYLHHIIPFRWRNSIPSSHPSPPSASSHHLPLSGGPGVLPREQLLISTLLLVSLAHYRSKKRGVWVEICVVRTQGVMRCLVRGLRWWVCLPPERESGF